MLFKTGCSVVLVLFLNAWHIHASKAQSLSLGDLHSCAIDSSGIAECWGDNGHGQLGIGSRTNRPFASQVIGLTGGVIAIQAGDIQTCAISEGSLYCWGNNGFGALGTGLPSSDLLWNSWPLSVDIPPDAEVTALAGGSQHMCAIVSGSVTCWGDNGYGQLGDGTFDARSTPAPISVGSGIPIAITAGGYHTCALVASVPIRRIWCWGNNASGELGNGTMDDSADPVLVSLGNATPIAVVAGAFHTCALLPMGKVNCWGNNSHGALGVGTNDDSSVPVAVQFAPGTEAIAIAAGDFFTCAIVNSGSGVQCWGWDLNGALGNGDGGSSTVPTPVVNMSLPFGTHAAAISAGGLHACVWLVGGPAAGIRCWGNNDSGELGIYSSDDQESPTSVTLGDGIFIGVFEFGVFE